MTEPPVGSQWQRAIIVLSGTVVSLAAVAILFWAQSIFIPIALAAFLTFVLSPVVSRLKGWGLGRTPAVIMTVFLAAVMLGGVAWLVTSQITGLLRELPRYSETIKKKVRVVRGIMVGSSRLGRMLAEISQELEVSPRSDESSRAEQDDREDKAAAAPKAVIIEPQTPAWLTRVASFLSPILEYVGELSLALVLVVFMLLKREELRNRMIRLMGDGRIVATTKFVDEAGHRISRFLLLQAIVNGTFGLILACGLLAIGVRYAILWGFLAALLRYLPYIGPYIAAVLPISLSLAMYDTWGPTLLVVSLFVILELVTANGIEPWLYGQSMGVSEIALLISAAFWAFLWGPIGLVLSSPMTVCLVMLGRYVPQLQFLSVLLGDEPALNPVVSFYQRLLAGDFDEAEDLICERLKTESPEQIYDTMLAPALSATRLSRSRGDITEADEDFILQSIEQIVDDIRERGRQKNGEPALDQGGSESAGGGAEAVTIFGVAARNRTEQIALEMLKNQLDPTRWRMRLVGPGTLTAELLELVAEEAPPLVCIMSLPPGGKGHARYLCKRLRGRFADLKIIACHWTQDASSGHEVECEPDAPPLALAGADSETRSLQETERELNSLLPVLAQGRSLVGAGRASA